MRYVMVTDFDNHWDKLPGNFTSYSPGMVKPKNAKGKLISGIETIFIKKEKYSDITENAWLGTVADINQVPGGIYFRVVIQKTIECPDEYIAYRNGWYIKE